LTGTPCASSSVWDGGAVGDVLVQQPDRDRVGEGLVDDGVHVADRPPGQGTAVAAAAVEELQVEPVQLPDRQRGEERLTDVGRR
jgi:hypothetical protein